MLILDKTGHKNENPGSGDTSQLLNCLPRILDISVAMIKYPDQKQPIEKFILAYVSEGVRVYNSSKQQPWWQGQETESYSFNHKQETEYKLEVRRGTNSQSLS